MKYRWFVVRLLLLAAFLYGVYQQDLASEQFGLGVGPLAFAFVGGALIARSWFLWSLPWMRLAEPSWFDSPFSLVNPLQFNHLFAWTSVGVGVVASVTSDLPKGIAFGHAAAAFGLGLLLGMRWGLRGKGSRSSPGA